MCGIAGILGQLDPPNRAALKRMNDAMTHRGPDGEGYWESTPDDSGRGVLLAHRRLAILDLSSAADQPMVDPVAGDVVVLNGEIYNYTELRRSLSAKGHAFTSTGDTAVMLRVLCEHGVEGVDKLRGMFAFAFWNVNERTLLLARDPHGIKPLYVAHNIDPAGTWSMLFASEVRAIVACGLLGKPRLNPQAIASVIWNGFVVGPDTAVAQIDAVLPSELRLYDSRGRERERRQYWTLQHSEERNSSIDEDEFGSQLSHCVRLHLASDAPLGVFLSGGVDSSAVANLAQRVSTGRIDTFALTFEEQRFNEGLIARSVADAIGTRHHEMLLTEQRFTSGLELALQSLDQPTFDGINSYYMSHAVREAGLKVALVGTGGDELFGGYATFRELPLLQRSRWIPRKLSVAAARLFTALRGSSSDLIPPQTRWAKLPEMLMRNADLLALYQMAYALFLPEFQRQLLSRSMHVVPRDGLPGPMRARLATEARGREARSAISVFEQRLFLGERLLRDTDAASMSASIEVRVPLVDQELTKHADRLPFGPRFQPIGRKAVLRRIGLQGLNPELFERPKSGFVLPYDSWLKRGLREVVGETLRDPQAITQAGLNPAAVEQLWRGFLAGAPGLYWSRVWALYVLIWWCRRHGVTL